MVSVYMSFDSVRFYWYYVQLGLTLSMKYLVMNAMSEECTVGFYVKYDVSLCECLYNIEIGVLLFNTRF